MTELGNFAKTIFLRTYAIDPDESWSDCARRVAKAVAGDDFKDLEEDIYWAISTRKFMPGGRYLAQSGKEINQFYNCFLFRSEDSREGWSTLLQKHVMALSTGGGAGTYYGDVRPKGQPIKKFGGVSSGPISLMNMVNEVARHVMAGGKRRSALWAGLPWNHGDIEEFISIKNWSSEVKAIKERDFNFPATLDMTNISVALDDEFFDKVQKDDSVRSLYYQICKNMCKTGEPGFSIDVGKESKNKLRNPCLPKWATLATPDGIARLENVEVGDIIWSGKQWTKVIKKWSTGIKPVYEYRTTAGTFVGTQNHKIVSNGIKIEVKEAEYIDTNQVNYEPEQDGLNPLNIIDGLVLGDGGIHKASNNLVGLYIGKNDLDYLNSEIKAFILQHRPGITEEFYEVNTTLKAGDLPKTYQRIIPEKYFRSYPIRARGFLRGLYSANGSVCGDKVTLKSASYRLINQVQEMLSFLGIRSYYTTNKSHEVEFENGTYTCKESYDLNITSDRQKFRDLIGFIQKDKTSRLEHACMIQSKSNGKVSYDVIDVKYLGDYEVFDITVEAEEHTFWNGGLLVSNCTEVVSDTDSDSCNLGSINFANIVDIEELKKVTRIATRFLYIGTTKSWSPHQDFSIIREKNRRIGLGLMGLHEWCIRHGERYEPNGELGKWLACWANISDSEAKKFSAKLGTPTPVAVRAIAPTGTISIIAETTSGVEPIFCVAYKRRYLGNDGKWPFQYVIDPTVERLLREDVIKSPNDIEDAFKLAQSVERRIRMQVFVQSFVDQAISSTINLPEYGESGNNNVKKFSEFLLEYLPKLRGITIYPQNSRPGQPIVPVTYETAIKHLAEVSTDDECKAGVCGL